MAADKVKVFYEWLVLETALAEHRPGWTLPCFPPAPLPTGTLLPPRTNGSLGGFHSKSRQNLLWKYRNLLTMGLTCQLSFHCLIYASRECLGKSFKLQFTSKPHSAQSLGLGECVLLPIIKGVRKQKHCLESGVLGGHGRGAQGRPWALCPCWVALGRALPGHRAFALSYRDFSFSQPATLGANRDKGQRFRYSCV